MAGRVSLQWGEMSERNKYLKFGAAIAVVIVSLAYLAWTGVEQSKSYYVTLRNCIR